MTARAQAMKSGWSLFAGAGLMAAVTGCSMTPPEPPVQAAAPVATVVPASTADTGPAAVRKTGTYPRFSEPLTAANVQLGDDEAVSMQEQLTALAGARKAGSISEAEYRRRLAELRKLASEHGTDAQAAIAN